MFSKIALSFFSMMIVSQSAFAGFTLKTKTPKPVPTAEQLCRREFANDLIKCVVTSFFQKPTVRFANLKTCVVSAKTEKFACLDQGSGPNQCEVSCQQNYDANVVTCQNTFDPSVCGGNVACETFYQSERANCISGEVDTLNACNATCPQ